MRKLTIEFIKKEFEKEGYELLSEEYIGAHSKLDYICSNGHKNSIRWSAWQQNQRCSYCYGNVGFSTIKNIKKEFEKEGYKLLDKIYKNNNQKLNYICPYGHKWCISWNNWQQGKRCPHCSNKIKKTIKVIKSEFEKENYKLITKIYKNNKQKLNYICPKGHRHSIRWDMWQQGQRCPVCFSIRNSGLGNPAWKGGISCEPYCDAWADKEYKESIKERDGYQCLNPDCLIKNPNDLTIHHIDYNKKNCHPNNLITLCRSCNSRANKDREWHTSWYEAIIHRRYTT